MRGQLVGLAASESMNLVFTMNSADCTLLGISRETDEISPLGHLTGTPLAFCVLEDGKVCSFECDARDPQRCAFLVYDIDSNALEQWLQLKEKEKQAKNQASEQSTTKVEDEDVITYLLFNTKLITNYETKTVAPGASNGKIEGFQKNTNDPQKASFVYKPLCNVAIEAKDAANESADVFSLEPSLVVIALSGRKSVRLAKIVRNLDNNQITAQLSKQQLRECVVSASFNRETRLIAVSFRDNSLTLYDTNWVARSNFACTYNGNPVELRNVAFTTMHTVIATRV